MNYSHPSEVVCFDRRRLQLLAKLTENIRLIKQKFQTSELGIIGAFHGTNTGDNTLGLSVFNVAKVRKIKGALQNFYKLNRYPKCRYSICAGGATGVEENILNLAEFTKDHVDTVSLIGMDFSSDIGKFKDKALKFLSKVKYISCRSEGQAQRLSLVLARNDIHFYLDNAFAYPFQLTKSVSNGKDSEQKILGFNTLNFFMTWVRRKGFYPGTPLASWYRRNNSELVNYLEEFGPAYIEYFQKIIDIYIARGWRIIHIPFTPEDDLFAKTFFDSRKISFRAFSPDPNNAFAQISNCNLFISTRYHSLIFSLIAGIPCIPFTYASKCNDLINDLGLNTDSAIDRLELVACFDQAIEKTLHPTPLTLDSEKLNVISNSVLSCINNSIQLIQS